MLADKLFEVEESKLNNLNNKCFLRISYDQILMNKNGVGKPLKKLLTKVEKTFCV